jgi:hypothetical protein
MGKKGQNFPSVQRQSILQYFYLQLFLYQLSPLTAYLAALSNQAFAQPAGQVSTGRPLIGNVLTQVGKVLAGHEAQLGKVLGGGNRMIGLVTPWDPRDC